MSTRIALPQGLKLAQAVLTTSDVSLYVVPTGTTIKLTEIVLTNTTASGVTVSISLVPSGGTAGVTNRIFEQVPVAAYSTILIGDLGEVMPTGEFLAAKASVAASVNLRANGEIVI
jgi:hypothetical protein